jgi:hypothetical protein
LRGRAAEEIVKMNRAGTMARVALLAVVLAGCSAPPHDEGIPVGLLLSYSGYLAAWAASHSG